jgi:glyoxylase-like metal-dependent hydrolase (beta-lactamase superfamily II)
MSPGWERLESELWETAGVLLVDGSRAVAIDPGVTPAEIEGIAGRVADAGADLEAILITHVHSDHTCGIGAFPDAEVSMGPLAAAVVASGDAARSVARQAEQHGFDYVGEPRCDRVLEPGVAATIGPFTVETTALPGHTDGGLAFRVRSEGLLVVGDYLSAFEYPFVYQSTAAYRASLAALLDLLRRDPPSVVVPGHGAALSADEAIAIGEQDLAYLHDVRQAVQAALEAGSSAAEAAEAGAALEPPRPAGEEGTQRLGNGSCQVAELVGSPG